MYKKVLVTGGSGFVGKRLQRIKPDWIYMSSRDCDLTNKEQFKDYLNLKKPDAVIHLAARVGGIKDSSNNQSEFFYLNSLINLNVIHESYKAGIKRVLSCLSTCVFPDINEVYPMIEEDLLKGEPTLTNYCYGYAKRNLYIQSKWYSKEHEVIYNTFTPSNLYGPDNKFDFEKGHLISSMIKKFDQAEEGDTLTFWGSGKPLRQHLYIDDLVKLIPELLVKHLSDLAIIIAPDENLSIREIVETYRDIENKNINIEFNNNLDGQHRKDGSNKNLLNLINNFKFTSLREGLEYTHKWYKNSKVHK
jgi:GDP-L-fucose synthase